MRSIGFTIVLALAALILCGLATWQWKTGNFDTLLGARATPVGSHLYSNFTPDQVKRIELTSGSAVATFELRPDGWHTIRPWDDRMDPRAAVSIINFTLGMRVEDISRLVKLDARKTGIDDSGISVRLEDARRKPLAKYRLGRVSPWKAEVEGMDQPVPTVFAMPRDKGRREHVYLCTGDITPLFKDGLKFLRDHRPFYFNPVTLRKIRLRSQQGELTLGRATPQSPWRIVQPLDLPTDPRAIKTLLEGIFELQALRVTDRAAVTLPATDNTARTSQIAITPFDSETETLLEILPPESPEAREAKALVSDRPNTVFDLPLKPEPGFVSLADLPLTVNELRDPTLTHLNIKSLRAISILPATAPEILITRKPPQPWMANAEGQSFEANEENLYALLKAVTTSRATGFVSDAATDFTPWGLDRPFLTLRFLGKEENQALTLRFGLDTKGTCYANRAGTPTVMRVDSALIQAIPVRAFEWKHARLWSLNRANLVAIVRKEGASPPLTLSYVFKDESWRADRDGTDVSVSLDPSRTNFMLGILEGLKVTRWLAANDAGALAALANPSLTFMVREKTEDENLNFTGFLDRTVTLAPATEDNPGFYYGLLNTGTNPFLLDRETYRKLAVDLFAK